MKKLCMWIILCLCAGLCLGAAAEEALPVVLGDGAPIPYFDGFTSDAVTDASLLTGVTGAAAGSMYQDFEKMGYGSMYEIVNRTLHMQNIAATDDYLALFFTLAYDKEIPFPEGRTQYNINNAIGFIDVLQGGEYIGMDIIAEEARLLDDRTLQCMLVYSLEAPLHPEQPIELFAFWDAEGNPTSGLRYQLDARNAVDPARVTTPGLEVPMVPKADAEGRHNGQVTVIKRIAQTPFGTRVALNVKDEGTYAFFSYGFADGDGSILPQYTCGWRSHSDASREHPYWMRNDIWLLNAQPLDTLQLLPISFDGFPEQTQEGIQQNLRTQFIPLDSLPTDVPLESGRTLHVQSMQIIPDGFEIAYRVDGDKGEYLNFVLADAAGNTLDYNYVSYSTHSPAKGLLYAGGYWSEAYKDRTVPRVTPEEVAKIGGMVAEYWAEEGHFVPEEAVVIDLR